MTLHFRPHASDMPELTSVITVNFNTGPLLVAGAQAVLSSTRPVELLVVDNASTDGSFDQLRRVIGGDPRVRLFENDANLGFAKANNQALVHARGEWLLFLNPDCLIQADTIDRMQEAMRRRPKAAMAGCLILNPDGTEQNGCRRDTPSPRKAFARAFGLAWLTRRLGIRSSWMRDFVRTGEPLPIEPVEVDAVSGAFMLVRRAAIDKVGPLDEGYFLHCEDLDWCERFRNAGYEVLFVPGASVVHDKGASSPGRSLKVLWHLHRGMLRYYGKFFRERHSLPFTWLVTAGVWLRFAALAPLAFVRQSWSRVGRS